MNQTVKLLLRTVIASAAAVLFIWFAAPVAYRILNIGNVSGMLICALIIFRSATAALYHRLKGILLRKRATRILLRAVQFGATAFLIYGMIISSFMICAMTPRDDKQATAIVLGAQVKPWGPSAVLQQRIDAAVAYLNDHPSAYAVVTGGQGDDEVMSEAACMRESMIKAGVDADRIITEDRAANTDENIRFSLQIINKRQLNRDIAIVTDSYHQLRARIIAHKQDASLSVSPVNTVNGYTGFWLYPTYFVREWFAVPAEIIK